MIITRAYMSSLVRKNKARYLSIITDNNVKFLVVERLDKQRSDHAIARRKDIEQYI